MDKKKKVMEYLEVSDESIKKAAEVLRLGGIVAFPTETVYGLGADAFNADAIVKVFEAKGRPRFDPLIIHIADTDTLNYVANLSLLPEERKKMLYLLIKNFWPGPLSVILPKSEKIPGIVTSGLSTAAIRFPANQIAQKLIEQAGGAVAAPSANPFGALSPTTAMHVKNGLKDKADIILDGGPCTVGVESSVLDITGEQVQLLRYGGVTKEEIESVIKEKIAVNSLHLQENDKNGAVSPGMLKSHYAPCTALNVFTVNELKEPETNAAWLFFNNESKDLWHKKFPDLHSKALCVLSCSGSITEAASCLFEKLHELDALGAEKIYAELAPCEGLGEAINDRLRRAEMQ